MAIAGKILVNAIENPFFIPPAVLLLTTLLAFFLLWALDGPSEPPS
jgi:hypothetical protein